MELINTLIIFCEGPHDVAFCRLVFKHCFNISPINWKFSQFPTPLNQLFKTSMGNHALQDMSLDMAHSFFLPARTLYSEEKKTLILLFNTGGKTRTDNPKNFLTDFLPLLQEATRFPDGADKAIKTCNYYFYMIEIMNRLLIYLLGVKKSFKVLEMKILLLKIL